MYIVNTLPIRTEKNRCSVWCPAWTDSVIGAIGQYAFRPLAEIYQYQSIFGTSFGRIDNFPSSWVPRRMRIVKWIESEPVHFTRQQFDYIEIRLSLF